MSDIYIPNMEMPTEEQSVITINIYADGVVTCYDDDVERKAIPVPDHGRLIQDDALDKIEHYHDGTFGLTDYERGWNAALLLCKKRIEAAPTIIPADQETAHERI